MFWVYFSVINAAWIKKDSTEINMAWQSQDEQIQEQGLLSISRHWVLPTWLLNQSNEATVVCFPSQSKQKAPGFPMIYTAYQPC